MKVTVLTTLMTGRWRTGGESPSTFPICRLLVSCLSRVFPLFFEQDCEEGVNPFFKIQNIGVLVSLMHQYNPFSFQPKKPRLDRADLKQVCLEH